MIRLILISKSTAVFAVLFFFVLFKSYSQKKVELINSGELINQAVELHDDGEFEEAIKLYEKISRNDTNYSLALAELSLSLLQSEEYEKTKQVCRRGIKLDTDEGHMFFTHYATALDEQEKPDSAIIIYKQGIEKFPNDQMLYFNLGITYNREKRYQEAVDVLKKSILLNPYHSSSHMALGRICAELGYITQAMLSLNMFLILEPQTDRSVEFLKYMDNWLGSDMSNETDSKVILSDDGDDYTKIDVLIRNRVALNSKYKPKSKLTYPVVMQTQVLMEKLKYKKNDGGFWMENYVPVFKDIYTNGQFAPYAYYILSGLNFQRVQKLVKKNKKKIKKLIIDLNSKVLKIRGSRVIEWDGKERPMQHWYYDSNSLSAIGEYDNDDEMKKGYWEYYYITGNIQTRGKYDSKGERTGLWEVFYNNGHIKEKANFVDGKLEGYHTYFYQNGQKSTEYFYKEGVATDSVKYYSNLGALIGLEFYVEDVLSGAGKRYYNNGKVNFDYTNKDGEIDGTITEYNPKDLIVYESDFKEGKRNGAYKTYYLNGQIKTDVNYKDGDYDGDGKSYYYTGQLKTIGQNIEGEPVGKWKEYFIDGTLASEYEYDEKGNYEGEYKVYDRDGKLAYTFVYEKDKMVSYKYYNKDGKVFKSGNKKGNKLTFEGFFPDGTKKVEGVFIDGEKEGEWTYYNKYGGLDDVDIYEKGKMTGIAKGYNYSGQLTSEAIYAEDKLDGYYKSYYSNGKIYAEGWYVNDDMQGDWYYYYPNGKLKEHSYYLNDELEGTSVLYNSTGLIDEEIVYKNGEDIKHYLYDTLGNVFQTVDFIKKSQKLEVKDIAGNIASIMNYNYNSLNGTVETYNYNGKLESKGQALNGEYDGEVLTYNKDGKLIARENYYLGSYHGKCYKYFKNGKLKEEKEYFEDEAIGTWFWYFDNGKISIKRPHKDGWVHGNVEYYDKDGLLEFVKIYEYGKLLGYTYEDKSGNLVEPIYFENGSGKMTGYYKNGQKSCETTFKEGYINGPLIYYYTNGKIKAESNVVNDNYEGVYKLYYKNGKLKELENYFYDELDGLSTYYYENGKIKEELNYSFGNLNGKCKYYNSKGKLTHERVFYMGDMISEKTF